MYYNRALLAISSREYLDAMLMWHMDQASNALAAYVHLDDKRAKNAFILQNMVVMELFDELERRTYVKTGIDFGQAQLPRGQ